MYSVDGGSTLSFFLFFSFFGSQIRGKGAAVYMVCENFHKRQFVFFYG